MTEDDLMGMAASEIIALRAELAEAKALLRDVQSSAVQAGRERWKRIDAFLASTAESDDTHRKAQGEK